MCESKRKQQKLAARTPTRHQATHLSERVRRALARVGAPQPHRAQRGHLDPDLSVLGVLVVLVVLLSHGAHGQLVVLVLRLVRVALGLGRRALRALLEKEEERGAAATQRVNGGPVKDDEPRLSLL